MADISEVKDEYITELEGSSRRKPAPNRKSKKKVTSKNMDCNYTKLSVSAHLVEQPFKGFNTKRPVTSGFRRASQSRNGHKVRSSTQATNSLLRSDKFEQASGSKVISRLHKSKVSCSTQKWLEIESAERPIVTTLSSNKEEKLKNESFIFSKAPPLHSQTLSSSRRSFGLASPIDSRHSRRKSYPASTLSVYSRARPLTTATDKRSQGIVVGTQTFQNYKRGHLQNNKSRWDKLNKDTVAIYSRPVYNIPSLKGPNKVHKIKNKAAVLDGQRLTKDNNKDTLTEDQQQKISFSCDETFWPDCGISENEEKAKTKKKKKKLKENEYNEEDKHKL